MKNVTKIEGFARGSFVVLALTFIVACSSGAQSAPPEQHEQLVGTARKPLVLVGGQTEQLPTADYLSSVGGASFDGTPPTAAGDIEVTTINGLPAGGTGTGSVSVVQTTHLVSAGFFTTNMTTEGTVDWVASGPSGPTFATDNIPRKVGGGGVLAQGVRAIQQTGTDIPVVGSCAACTIQLTWTAANAATTFASGVFAFLVVHVYNSATGGPFGWESVAPANTSQLVLRQYLAAYSMTNVSCTGTLSDGSGTVSTTPFTTTTAADTYIKNVWTYHAATVDAKLIVVCVGTAVANVGWANQMEWYGETLNTI